MTCFCITKYSKIQTTGAEYFRHRPMRFKLILNRSLYHSLRAMPAKIIIPVSLVRISKPAKIKYRFCPAATSKGIDVAQKPNTKNSNQNSI